MSKPTTLPARHEKAAGNKAVSYAKLGEAGRLLLQGESYRQASIKSGVGQEKLRREFPGLGKKRKHSASALTTAHMYLQTGVSYRRASALTGVPDATLRNKFPGYGVQQRIITDEMKEGMEAMLDDGASYAEVGRSYGVSWNSVRRYFPGRGWSPQEKGEYAQMLHEEKRLLAS